MQAIQLTVKQFELCLRRLTALPVDLTLLLRFDLDVDSRYPIFYGNEIGVAAVFLEHPFDFAPGKTTDESQRAAVHAKIFQYDRDIDPLAAGIDHL